MAPVSIVESTNVRATYLAIFENEAKTTGDRFERAKGIRRVSHSTEE
jgi:hypothetical protein